MLLYYFTTQDFNLTALKKQAIKDRPY